MRSSEESLEPFNEQPNESICLQITVINKPCREIHIQSDSITWASSCSNDFRLYLEVFAPPQIELRLFFIAPWLMRSFGRDQAKCSNTDRYLHIIIASLNKVGYCFVFTSRTNFHWVNRVWSLFFFLLVNMRNESFDIGKLIPNRMFPKCFWP